MAGTVTRMRRAVVLLVLAAAVAGGGGAAAQAAPGLAYGLQDDAWISYGPGTIEERIATLERLGIRLVRTTLRWDRIQPERGRFDWSRPDGVLPALDAAGVEVLVTLYGTPAWANGGAGRNVPPRLAADFARFARAVALRYPFVRRFTIWNEPNQRRWLRPASPALYVVRLLNPAYAAIHAASPDALVAGGVTAPRGGIGGVSPVSFIRGMGAAGARLDAYAHHPYALSRTETPWGGGCDHCETITLSTIGRLLVETRRAFKRPVRIWLTELGYQSNPPDRLLGVPLAVQGSYIAAAAYKAWATPRVDLLIQYLFRDEPGLDRWQSGVETVGGITKPALGALPLPLAQVSRTGLRTTLWGEVRPGSGGRRYLLQRWDGARWDAVGGSFATAPSGVLTRVVRAGAGARFRLVAAGLPPGNTLVVR